MSVWSRSSAGAAVLATFAFAFASNVGCEARPAKPSAAPAASASASARPAPCEARVTELRSFLRTLAAEGEVHAELVRTSEDRSVDRRFPTVAVPKLEQRPAPLPTAAFVELGDGALRFADVRGRAVDAAARATVLRAAVESGFSLRPSNGSGRPRHPLVLAVAANERWRDVVSVVESARGAGFRQVLFVFEVPTHASAPKDEGVAARIRALASDPSAMPWKRDVAIAGELARANPRCPAIASPFQPEAPGSAEKQAQLEDFLAHVPESVFACGCNADLEAIRAFAWARHGRQWGPPTVTHAIELSTGPDDPAERLAQPAETPWSRAVPAIVEAAKRARPVALASE